MLCWRTLLLWRRRRLLLLLLLLLLLWLLRLLLVIRTRSTHHRHRLAAAGARWGRRWRESAEWLSALGEVLSGALDFCKESVSRIPDPCREACPCHVLPPVVAAQHSTDTFHVKLSLRHTVKLRDKGIGLVPVHGRAGAWIHVTRCPAAAVHTVSGT